MAFSSVEFLLAMLTAVIFIAYRSTGKRYLRRVALILLLISVIGLVVGTLYIGKR